MAIQFTTQWFNPVIRTGKTTGKWMTGVERGDWPTARDSVNGMMDKHMRGRVLCHIPMQAPGEEKPRIHILMVKEWSKAGTETYKNLGLIEKLSEQGIKIE